MSLVQSSVLPRVNEEGCVEALADEIAVAADPLLLRCEILYVDDCPIDVNLAAQRTGAEGA